jgi:hypothetical protein
MKTTVKQVKTLKSRKNVYTRKHYKSKDGMLTTVWGPSTWHMLHTISFNYPVSPTCDEKRQYRNFILSLKDVLPCGKCRENLKMNFSQFPITIKHMTSRKTFSLYVYKLHEKINKMLKKKSELTYDNVRERYEHFRARCALPLEDLKIQLSLEEKSNKEKGCTEPIYGEKSKCILHIVPQSKKCDTFQMDSKCIKKKL